VVGYLIGLGTRNGGTLLCVHMRARKVCVSPRVWRPLQSFDFGQDEGAKRQRAAGLAASTYTRGWRGRAEDTQRSARRREKTVGTTGSPGRRGWGRESWRFTSSAPRASPATIS
jgi:hypothetical protein